MSWFWLLLFLLEILGFYGHEGLNCALLSYYTVQVDQAFRETCFLLLHNQDNLNPHYPIMQVLKFSQWCSTGICSGVLLFVTVQLIPDVLRQGNGLISQIMEPLSCLVCFMMAKKNIIHAACMGMYD